MAGFNVPPGGPVPQMTPELLAQLAAAGFRPPGAMGMPGMGGQQPQPGFNVGQGAAGLGAGLGMLAGMGGDGTIMNAGPQGSGPGGAYTTAEGMAMAGMGDGQVLSPLNPSYGDLGGGAAPGAGSVLDPLTGLWRKLFAR